MTIQCERSRAVNYTRGFLLSLLNPKRTPRVPLAIRQHAGRCLRHYPWPSEMERTAEKCPELWDETGIKIRIPR